MDQTDTFRAFVPDVNPVDQPFVRLAAKHSGDWLRAEHSRHITHVKNRAFDLERHVSLGFDPRQRDQLH